MVVSEKDNQSSVDYIGRYLNIKFTHDNLARSGDHFSVTLQLQNNGLLPITSDGKWSIFFHLIRRIEPVKKVADGYILTDSGFKVKHLLGNLFRLYPVDGLFKPLLPGKMIVVKLEATYWQCSRFDVMPNWYVSAPGLQPRYLESTKGESLSFVGPSDSKRKWKRNYEDLFDPYTAEVRYDINKDVKIESNVPHVLPTPLKITYPDNTKMTFGGPNWVIVDSDAFSIYVASLSREYIEYAFIKNSNIHNTYIIHCTRYLD